MKVHLNATPVCMAKSQAITLTDAVGARINCRQGSLWITQDHDSRDIVLASGESFIPDRPGRTIVYALADSSVEMLAQRRRPLSLMPALRRLRRSLAVLPRLATSLRSYA